MLKELGPKDKGDLVIHWWTLSLSQGKAWSLCRPRVSLVSSTPLEGGRSSGFKSELSWVLGIDWRGSILRYWLCDGSPVIPCWIQLNVWCGRWGVDLMYPFTLLIKLWPVTLILCQSFICLCPDQCHQWKLKLSQQSNRTCEGFCQHLKAKPPSTLKSAVQSFISIGVQNLSSSSFKRGNSCAQWSPNTSLGQWLITFADILCPLDND